jgi:lipoate-protein ligase A
MAAFFESLELVLDSLPHNAAVNMAVDEVLLKHANRPILRYYFWERPSVSFGYFEEFAPIEAAHPNREPVRRWTGGGIVLHGKGEDQTFSLIVPRSEPFLNLSTGESYRAIHERIAEILREAGVGAQVAPVHAPKISQACFENAAQFDLVVESRKIVGGAQRRNRCGMLHQGSIQAPNLPGDFAQKLASSISQGFASRDLTSSELDEAEKLEREKYGTQEWLRKK